MKKKAKVKRAVKKQSIVNPIPMVINNTPTQPTHADVMRVVAEKSNWLTTVDKRKLAARYDMSVYAVMRQVRGGIKKPSYDLICDALDMIRENEKKLITRI